MQTGMRLSLSPMIEGAWPVYLPPHVQRGVWTDFSARLTGAFEMGDPFVLSLAKTEERLFVIKASRRISLPRLSCMKNLDGGWLPTEVVLK